MKTVAICDDSMFQRRIISDMLDELGYSVQQFSEGQKLLDFIEGSPADLTMIVLDILMPDMTGVDILKKLKDSGNEVPVVMLSADIQEVRKSECFELGASKFLNKPVKKEELLEILNELL